MNAFDKRMEEIARGGLRSTDLDLIQVNVGLRCNQRCRHCHLQAGPDRIEVMARPVMKAVVDAADAARCSLVDITGGAPELNPHLADFIRALRTRGREVQMRTNLTALLEPDRERFFSFFREHRVRLVASMPCYLEENVCAQRGPGVYEKSIEVMKRLNALGYGRDPELPLRLVYNPGGPFLPPAQSLLEADYRKRLRDAFGIEFTDLITIANMPIGRFRSELRRTHKERQYQKLLETSFNSGTVEGLMCRHQISVGWDGTLYDCDFNLALGSPVNHGAPDHIGSFDTALLAKRRIVTGPHCFGCTAGQGSSCGGALA